MMERMKEIREGYDKKQRDVAIAMHIKRSTYAVFENNHNIIPLKRLNDFANYFDVSIDYVTGLSDQKKYLSYKKEIDMEKVRERLKYIRKKHKYTQQKLAKYLNTSPSVISDYERGRYLISTVFIYEFAKKFHVSIDYILGKID